MLSFSHQLLLVISEPPPPSSSGARLLAITCIKLFVAVVLSRYCITLGRGRVGAGGSLAHFLLVGGLAYAQDGVGSLIWLVYS